MKPAARAAFVEFSSPLEGCIDHLYLDIRGLVTTAIGILIDPIDAARALPWQQEDGAAATDEQIVTEWHTIKGNVQLAHQGHRAAKAFCKLHLSPAGIEQVVGAKLDEMARHLARRFPAFEEWPADAQLATLSMAWACGPAFRFGNLERALNAGDFMGAAASCEINAVGNPGIVPRNRENRILYTNAAWTPDPDLLVWPSQLRGPPTAA